MAMDNATKFPPDVLRDLIADALHAVKSYALPQVCVDIGLQPAVAPSDATEANSSKRSYVKTRIASWKLPQLIGLAERVLEVCASDDLEDAVSELTTPPGLRFSEIGRRDVLKTLNFLGPLFGDLPYVESLRSAFGDRRFQPAHNSILGFALSLEAEITRHAVQNDDWSHEVLLIKCGALDCAQARFFALLEKLLHPIARRDAEQGELATRLNAVLSREGFAVQATGTESGYAVYSVVRIHGGVSGTMKNLIFASVGAKPELVFRDAVNNDVEITKHADKVLVYDKPLPPSGLLLWKDLRDWWGEVKDIPKADSASKSLYRRLLDAVIKSGSPGELAIFKCYYEAYSKALGDRLPALIPQVYLHFDPFTQRERGDEKVLARQRMDFLLMLDHGARVVIEVDGQQHYGVLDMPGYPHYRTSPPLYAEMVREDRRLTLRGYHVFRFGGHEFVDVDMQQRTIGSASRRCVTNFFDALLSRHGVFWHPVTTVD